MVTFRQTAELAFLFAKGGNLWVQNGVLDTLRLRSNNRESLGITAAKAGDVPAHQIDA